MKMGAVWSGVQAAASSAPFRGLQHTPPHPPAIHPGFRAHHAVDHFHLGHLQAEDGHALVLVDRHVAGDVERERGLAHRRPSRQDDQIGGLEPADDGVHVAEARLATHGMVPLRHGPLQLGEALADEFSDGLELAAHPGLRDLEDHLLGPVDEIHRRLLPPIPHLGDLAPHLDERAKEIVLADDLRVVPGVGRRGNGGDQAVDIGPPADRLKLARLASSSLR